MRARRFVHSLKAACTSSLLAAALVMSAAAHEVAGREPLSLNHAAETGLAAAVAIYGLSSTDGASCDGPLPASELRRREAASDDLDDPPVRVGAGFVIDGHGHVVTAAHVVAGCDRIVVKLPDGRVALARKVGEDLGADIALLALPSRPPAPILGRSSTLRPGDWVLAVGNPFGLRRAVSAGIVGARDQYLGGDTDTPYIQSDVSMSPGSSGGPLLDRSGAVVGMNARVIVSPDGGPGVAFSVPIETSARNGRQAGSCLLPMQRKVHRRGARTLARRPARDASVAVQPVG